MADTNRIRAFSSPELVPSTTNFTDRWDDPNLEGIAANVKLLLKLIQEHNEASMKDNDDRKSQRVAGMIGIVDDVKTRIEKAQSFGKKRAAELRRCNTDLRRNVPKEKRPQEAMADEKDRLRKELNASLAARKSLEIMCSSMGKEKEIMAKELSKKVQELNEMEELISDLKAQNEKLLAKVQACAVEHKKKKSTSTNSEETQGNEALRERNKALSEQLLRSLDGYKSMKRKLKDAREENHEISATMEEMSVDVKAGLDRIRSFRERIAAGKNEQDVDIAMEISALDDMFEGFSVKISQHRQAQSGCVKPKNEVNPSKHPLLA